MLVIARDQLVASFNLWVKAYIPMFTSSTMVATTCVRLKSLWDDMPKANKVGQGCRPVVYTTVGIKEQTESA
jgi:hypothetical protein